MGTKVVTPQLTVAINAAVDSASGSGVEQATTTLVRGLADLGGSGEIYAVVTSPLVPRWMDRYAAGRVQVVVAPRSLFDPRSMSELRLRQALRRVAGPVRGVVRTLRRRGSRHVGPEGLARSDGFLESLGPQVIHFPYQRYLRTSVPSIFEPWDLQHRHLPEFFTTVELAWREATYRPACEEAHAVVVASDWVRADLVKQFDLSPRKIYRIRRGSPTALIAAPSDSDVRETRDRRHLPDVFLLYPAQTWPHKNHLGLLDAVARLREGGVRVSIVCCGTQNGHFAAIRRRIGELGLGEQVRFLGHVPGPELLTLYRLARGVVIPSLFEGYGFPLIEAFHEDVPVASSNATCLPEMAGPGALLFDPRSVTEMAAAIATLWSSAERREQLVRLGRSRLAEFDPARAARTYRALYRSLGGATLTGDDSELLEAARPAGTMGESES